MSLAIPGRICYPLLCAHPMRGGQLPPRDSMPPARAPRPLWASVFLLTEQWLDSGPLGRDTRVCCSPASPVSPLWPQRSPFALRIASRLLGHWPPQPLQLRASPHKPVQSGNMPSPLQPPCLCLGWSHPPAPGQVDGPVQASPGTPLAHLTLVWAPRGHEGHWLDSCPRPPPVQIESCPQDARPSVASGLEGKCLT